MLQFNWGYKESEGSHFPSAWECKHTIVLKHLFGESIRISVARRLGGINSALFPGYVANSASAVAAIRVSESVYAELFWIEEGEQV